MDFEKASPAATKLFELKPLGASQDLAKIITYQSAKLWDVFHGISSDNAEVMRLVAIAKTNLETASLYAVKAVTRIHE